MATKKQKILQHLKTRKRGITGQEALRLYGLYRLSGEIHELRKAGYNIKTEMMEEVNENGDKVTYARYYM